MDQTAAFNQVARSLASIGVPEHRQETFLEEVARQAGEVPTHLDLKRLLHPPAPATDLDSPLTFVARDLRAEIVDTKEHLIDMITAHEQDFIEAPVLRRQLDLARETLATYTESARTSPTSPVTAFTELPDLDDSDLDETKLKGVIHAHLLCTQPSNFEEYFKRVIIPTLASCQTTEDVNPAFYSLLSRSEESARNILDIIREYASHGLIHPESIAYRLSYLQYNLVPAVIINLNKTEGALVAILRNQLKMLPKIAKRDEAYAQKAAALNRLFIELEKWNTVFTKSHRLVRLLEQRVPRTQPETP